MSARVNVAVSDIQFCIDAIAHSHEQKARLRLEHILAAAPLPQDSPCILCAGKCRGHGLADPVSWEPEVGSVAEAVASQVRESREGMRSAILRDLGADQKRYNEDSPTHRAFGFCIDIAAKAEV